MAPLAPLPGSAYTYTSIINSNVKRDTLTLKSLNFNLPSVDLRSFFFLCKT